MRINPLIKIYLIFFATGGTALLYESAWQKFLVSLTGNDWRGNAIILGLFLAALGLGYQAFGRISQRQSSEQLIKLTGWIEILIGLLALLFIPGYQLTFTLLNSIDTNLSIEIFFSAILICPAAFLMGGNLPLITQATANVAEPARTHANLYLFNTAGAFFGCLLSGFFLIPELGLNQTLIVGALVNILAGILLLKTSLLSPPPDRNKQAHSPTSLEAAPAYPISLAPLITLCALSGFIALSLQNILMRLLSLTFGGTEYAFTLVVATYVVMLSLGTKLFVQILRLSILSNCLLSLIGLVLIYLSVPRWPYSFHLLRIQLANTSTGFYLYHLLALIGLMLISALAIMPLGAILPLAFAKTCNMSKKYGLFVGRIYAANALGCFLGCLLSGYLGFQYLNLNGLLALLLALTAVACFLSYRAERKFCRTAKGLLILLIGLTPILVMNLHWPVERLAIGMFHEKTRQDYSFKGASGFYKKVLKDAQVLAHRDGANSSVSVVEFKSDTPGLDGNTFNRSLMINGKSDGNTEGDLILMRLSALISAIWLNPANKNQSAVIGYGTGLTSGLLTQIPWITKVDSIEIAKEVAEFAPYFDFANGNVSQNSKHSFVIADGFHYLARKQSGYDLILSQLSNFWMAGTEKLFTAEFYKLASQRLNKHGIFLQWISLWGLSPETTRVAIKTFSKGFIDSRFFAFGPSLFMLGRNEPFDLGSLKVAAINLKNASSLLDTSKLGITDLNQLLAHEQWIPETALQMTPQHNLTHPKLAYLAGKDFFEDLSSMPDDILTPQAWRDSLQAASRSLTALWTEVAPNWNFMNIAQQACGARQVNLVEPNWRFSRSACREAIIQLMKNGNANIPSSIQADIDWVKDFESGSPTAKSPESSYLALKEISSFAEMNSVYAPLSLKHLKWRISVCYQKLDAASKKCRENFISLLKDLNQSTWAKTESEILARELNIVKSTPVSSKTK